MSVIADLARSGPEKLCNISAHNHVCFRIKVASAQDDGSVGG
jgi:hypothetical protein